VSDRRALRQRLLVVAPWLARTDVGPQAVEAGPCDRCGQAPRLLPTCGPAGAAAVCRDCARRLGDDGWCAGHQEEGAAARAWAEQLPDRWAELVTLWWIATGEVRVDAAGGPQDPAALDRLLGSGTS
jgi:hypothetical protein